MPAAGNGRRGGQAAPGCAARLRQDRAGTERSRSPTRLHVPVARRPVSRASMGSSGRTGAIHVACLERRALREGRDVLPADPRPPSRQSVRVGPREEEGKGLVGPPLPVDDGSMSAPRRSFDRAGGLVPRVRGSRAPLGGLTRDRSHERRLGPSPGAPWTRPSLHSRSVGCDYSPLRSPKRSGPRQDRSGPEAKPSATFRGECY